MRPRDKFRLCAMGVALALGAGLTVSAVSASGAVTGHGPVLRVTGSPSPAITGQSSAALGQDTTAVQNTTVTLPTGEPVRLETAQDGAQQVTPVAAGSTTTFTRFTWGGDQYVIPDQAVPFLHSVLDPELFDVSYLARAHLGTGATGIPVRITYDSTAAASAATSILPGVHVTGRSGATATATLTDGQATTLGELLSSRWRTGTLLGISKISLAPPSGAPARPDSPAQVPARASAAVTGVPYYTLTINATDLDGNPGVFAGIVQDVSNASLFDQTSCIENLPSLCDFTTATGSESLSVPAGTYSLAISIVTPDPSGSGYDTALVVRPQVTVDGDTTVSLDARTAVPYRARLSTPVTATQRIDELEYWRTSVTGGGNGAAGGSLLGVPLLLGLVAISPPVPLHADSLLATPTAAVTKGSFAFDANSYLETGSATSPGPTYAVDFPYQGKIPASLTYTVPVADLTAVHSQIHQTPSVCGDEELNTFGYLELAPGQWERTMYFATSTLPPGPRTDYWYSGDPTLDYWQAGIWTGCVSYFSPVQRISPGQHLSEVWNTLPAAPSAIAPPIQQPDDESVTAGSDPRLAVCTACRQGDIGTVDVLPFAGSDTTIYSDQPVFTGGGTGDIEFYRDGTLAIDTAAQSGLAVGAYPWGLELPLLPYAASYQLDSTESRPDDSAATVDTDWTFRSSPDDAATRLPATVSCEPDASLACSFLPLLFVSYDLPLNYDDEAVAGTPEKVGFTVTGQQGAPAPAGTSATVSASFDNGQTWTAARPATSLGGGKFTTTISQPGLSATSGCVSLRVTAKDNADSGITQTLVCAYGLTS